MKKNNLLFAMVLFYLLFSAGLPQAEANNIAVSNASLTGINLAAGTVKVQFDISWQNSWRTTTSWTSTDAAWVFVKYSTDAGVTWTTATLKTSGTNPAGFSQGTGTGLNIVAPADLKGAFLQRSADGSGGVSTSSIQFVWDYAANGLSGASTARVKVFAIEMVYIPTGAFSLGSGGSESGAFYKSTTSTDTYSVSSEAAINVGTTANYLYYPNTSTYSGDQAGPIPAAFPKGYNALYLMKYEISEGQWVDFFNTLTSTQKTARDITDSTGKNSDAVVYRNTVSWTSGNATTTRPDRACNYLSWADLTAYADWAGLRPMTELEFEKAARGPNSAIANEYAWGNATTPTAAAAISGTENGTETITTSGANCNYNGVTFSGGDAGQGPLRCGIFATGSSTRASSGSGYYGNMELSGSLWERCVTVGNATGRAFTGLHGDGALDTTGNANVSLWPGTNATGTGFRGGSWYADASYARVSDRSSAAYTSALRSTTYGARLARTSP